MDQQVDDFEPDVFSRRCDSRDVLFGLTSRWGMLTIGALMEDDFRFNALRRRVDGVSERMLSQTLQALERDGFVTRTVVQAIPPIVEYSLTELGRRIGAVVLDLIETVQTSLPQVLDARAAHESNTADPDR
ncbi:helix-turn-helix domain-containing protein [Williamsia sp. CHRR-6]|uniref:winged helix-turn-helix transcriptional regulator n=1 Tax=Williamsia sp. CHRR-6 TaxID=2835871 RepID=UPI001BD99E56|nr:helix-turn-helix domain-containing protein [Williamsia sp. CHRR-6]MBT0568528.1 helix-turn-helix transcriptional regulator [Williamsia sp. CHRR-6]